MHGELKLMWYSSIKKYQSLDCDDNVSDTAAKTLISALNHEPRMQAHAWQAEAHVVQQQQEVPVAGL